MWETYQLPTRGNFSLRKIALTFLAVITSAFLLTILSSPTAFAADASWQDEQISYDSKQYARENTGMTANELQDKVIYSNKEQGADRALIIYFPTNSDTTKDFPATYQEFNIDPASGSITTPRGPPKQITVAQKPAQKNKTNCDISGIGWMICPVARFIADGMDRIFSIVTGYLEVKPITTDNNSGLYQAWEVARGLANLVFIVAFLIIVYSHLTSAGISNYDLKKMIPKLVIAAILVNISYYICAIAVDVSNILGHSVQQALIDIRKSLQAPNAVDLNQTSWKNITEYVLSGGAIAGGAIAAKAAFLGGAAGGTISGLSFLLFPILVSGALAVLIAVLVLAARQALITVLIVAAPLAFVAYLLPNTEKWFDKWKDLLITMLLVFPLFSLLFGGAQLASFIIIQNADQISVVIFAMFIQVAPLVMTPFLVRFSGSLLGRLAGMVNDPKKGMVDRARGWATDKAEVQRAKGREAAANGGGTRFQRAAYRREMDKMHRDSWKKRGESAMDAGWHHDARYGRHHEGMARADIIKKAGESAANTHVEQVKARDRDLQKYMGTTRTHEAATKQLQQADETQWQEALSRNMEANNIYKAYAHPARQILEDQRIADSRAVAAQAMQKIEYAGDLIKSEALQQAAGGIADNGAQRALATAVSEHRKDYNDRIAEAQAILKHYNLSGKQRQDHALGEEVVARDDKGNIKILRKDSLFTREAAIETQLTTGTYQEVEQIIQRSGKELEPFKTTIAAGIASNKLSSKAVFLGGKTIDDTSQGKITDMDKLMEAVTATIARGKVSANDLATNENTALVRIKEAIKFKATYRTALSADENAALDANIVALKQAAQHVLNTPTINANLRENSRVELKEIINLP